MTRIAVIGAGITGVTSAHTLSKLGYDVLVVDRLRYSASDTSYANGGQLSASNAEVWNSVATLGKALRWMPRRDAPLLMNPAPGWHKYSWLAAFVGGIARYRANTMETVRLALQAREHLLRTAAEEGIEFDLERRGILHIYHDRASFEAGRKANELLRAAGLERHAVTPAEIRAIEPAYTRPCHGGFFTPSDATGDIRKFTRGLAAACARRGVEFLMETEVRRVRPQERGFDLEVAVAGGDGPTRVRADAVVVCAASDSRRLARMLGDDINVYPVKGYSITVNLDAASERAAPWVSFLDEQAKIVTSRLGAARFRVAGTAEINGFNRDIRHDRIQPLVRWVRDHFPEVDTSAVEPWCGLRPMMPDMMPRVRAGRLPGVFYNTGHGHLGWTLSAATAHRLGEIVARALPRGERAAAGMPG